MDHKKEKKDHDALFNHYKGFFILPASMAGHFSDSPVYEHT